MYKVAVSARIIKVPSKCCCCATSNHSGTYQATATRTTGKRVVRTQEKTLDLPICEDCNKWIGFVYLSRRFFALSILAILLTWFLGADSYYFVYSMAGSMLLAILGLFFRKKGLDVKRDMAVSSTPVIYHRWDGSIQYLSIANRDFYNAFCDINANKLVS